MIHTVAPILIAPLFWLPLMSAVRNTLPYKNRLAGQGHQVHRDRQQRRHLHRQDEKGRNQIVATLMMLATTTMSHQNKLLSATSPCQRRARKRRQPALSDSGIARRVELSHCSCRPHHLRSEPPCSSCCIAILAGK